jgi:hypothetical protein
VGHQIFRWTSVPSRYSHGSLVYKIHLIYMLLEGSQALLSADHDFLEEQNPFSANEVPL